MSFHTCWSVKPTDGQPGMPLDDLLARFADAFPVHKFDAEGARQGALRYLAALEAITKVVADSPGAEDAVLSFSIWPEQDRSVSEVLVRFATEEHQRAGCVLLARLAEALGWEAEDVSDEVG